MKIAVVGFGMMGRQIAQVFAQHGYTVEATDEDRDALAGGINEIENGPFGVKAALSKGKITADEASKTLAMVRTSPRLEDACKDAHLVIEAVFEDLQLKQRLFAKIEPASPPTAILASNTSTISIDRISEKMSHKKRVLGMHFFNPVPVTGLVEIIQGKDTLSEAVDEASGIVRQIGKTPVVARDEPGFIANRLGLTLYIEASKLLAEGTASIGDIDTCMKLGYNHPMGPFELADFVGLDTRLRNLESLYQFTGDGKWMPPMILREMVNEGYLGDPARKKGSNGGYYEYLHVKR